MLVKATLKALEIIKVTSSRMIQFPLLLGLVGVCVVTLSLYLTLFFTIQHVYFKVSIVNFSTVINFLNSPVTTHLLQTLFCILCLVVATFILAIFAFTTTFLLINKDFDKTKSNKDFYGIFKMSYSNLLRYAAIVTFGYMKQVFNIFNITDKLEILQDYCNGTYTPRVDKYNDPLNLLLFPTLVDQSHLQLNEGRMASQNFIYTQWGNSVKPSYIFMYITYVVFIAIGLVAYCLSTFTTLSRETIFLIGLVLIVIYGSFRYLIEIVLAVEIYNYYRTKKSLIYSQEFIQSLFTTSEKK